MGKLDNPLVLAIALGLLVAIVNLVLTIFVVLRRTRRNHYFALKDQARAQLAGTVRDACRGSRKAVRALDAYKDAATRDAIEELLLASVTTRTQHIITQLMVELGYVARWSKRAFSLAYAGRFGRSVNVIRRSRVFAVRRAVAAGHLGYLHRSVAAPLMIDALRDPSPLVISVAADALARTGCPSGLTPLLDLLRRAVDEDNVASGRGSKAALVTLRPDPEALAAAYSPLESKRFRMAILDILHELHCSANAKHKLSNPALIQAMRDPDPEIRARAVRLIPMLHVESKAITTALRDESPLVRLRAIHPGSVADAELFDNVHDERWRVRAAVVAALSNGSGREQLLDKLLSTEDRYAAEQIMEQWQLSGELRYCIARLNDDSAFVDQLVCRKAVELRMDSLLIEALQPQTSETLLIRLLDITQHSTHAARPLRLALLAQCSSEKVGSIARRQLQQLDGTRAEVVGAA